jgi:hypothetical protein
MDLAYGNSLPKGNRAVLDLNQENKKRCREKNFIAVCRVERTDSIRGEDGEWDLEFAGRGLLNSLRGGDPAFHRS